MKRCKIHGGKMIGAGGAFLILALLGAATPAAAGEAWPPILPEELALKDDPLRAGAAAVMLYWEVFSNHAESFESHHVRVKVLTAAGKERANVELPFIKGRIDVKDIEARVVQPDGREVRFTGQVYEKSIAKSRWVKILAKTFTLPEVEVGSILEYKYKMRWDSMRLLAPPWRVQGELSLLRGRFRLKPYVGLYYTLQWTFWLPGHKGLEQKGGEWFLEVQNIPALPKEPYSVPAEIAAQRVQFYYLFRDEQFQAKTAEEFWRDKGKAYYKDAEEFIGKRKNVEKEMARLVSPADPPEVKLRKLYARAQQLALESYEQQRAAAARGKEPPKPSKHADDMLKRGYGTGYDVDRFLAAMARAAGFEADIVWLATRRDKLFSRGMLDASQLDAYVVWVRAAGKEYFLDPATRHCPFGLLPWDHTGVEGIRPRKDGAEFVKTPQPLSSDSLVKRRATLQLQEDGTVEGEVEAVFHGYEAIDHRYNAEDEDEAARREELEEEVRDWLPSTAEVKVVEMGPWVGSDEPLRVKFTVSIPGYADATGQRLLLPLAVFQTDRRHPFEHVQRTSSVYFPMPWEESDEVTIELPEGYKVEGLPAAQKTPTGSARYELSVENDGGRLRIRRTFVMAGIYFVTDKYPMLREFYTRVRTSDEQQAILRMAEAAQQD